MSMNRDETRQHHLTCAMLASLDLDPGRASKAYAPASCMYSSDQPTTRRRRRDLQRRILPTRATQPPRIYLTEYYCTLLPLYLHTYREYVR